MSITAYPQLLERLVTIIIIIIIIIIVIILTIWFTSRLLIFDHFPFVERALTYLFI